jgi:hypothetical protein
MQITVHRGSNGPTHEAWSILGRKDDREFLGWTASLPRHYKAHNPWSPSFKPVDLPRWRAALPHNLPVGRYQFLFDLLESDPDLWLQLSWRG